MAEGVEAEMGEVEEPDAVVGKDELDEDDEMEVDGDALLDSGNEVALEP